MAGRPRVVTTSEQRIELSTLAGSDRRDEADRARAILLSADGWTSGQIGRVFGVTADTVRRWRGWFAADGVPGLRAKPHPGAAPVKSEAALAVAGEVLSQPVTDRVNWTLPRLQTEIAIRSKLTISKSQLSKALKKRGFRWRRPRHCLNGRQEAQAVDRSGLRLKLFKQQAMAGDIVLLFGDESEVLTHPYLAHAWARRGADLRVPAPGQSRKLALLGVIDHVTGELIVHTSPTKRSTDFIALLEIIDRRYGPQPGRIVVPVVLVLDNGPIHVSKLTRAELAKRPWLTIEWMPKYAPELNDIERVWRDLKCHFLAHQTFRSVEALQNAVADAIRKLHEERITHLCLVQQIAA